MKDVLHNFELLGNAVVRQAASDYRVALVKQHYAHLEENERAIRDWDEEVASLERFFSGEGVMAYTRLDGVALMERLKQEIIDYNYDLKTLKKELRLKQGGDP